MLEQLKSGDAGAQARWWKRGRPAVRAICAHILGAGPEAEDLADEVMTDFLFKYVQQLSREEALESYLRLMAVRRALRARELRRRTIFQELPQKSEDRPLPDEVAGWAQLVPRLPDCLGKLTPKARQAIRLRFQADLTHENIGGMIGGSKQYIGRLLNQSIRALRDCLERG